MARRKKHDDEAEDRALFKKLMDEKHGGKRASKRLDKFARGGRTKHKGIHISIHHHRDANQDAPPLAPGVIGGAAGPMSGLPAPPPPGGALPPPPMGANPLMRKSGGRAPSPYKSGISTPENLSKWAEYAAKNSYARGGKVTMKGGADSGVGRLDKVRAHRGRRGS